MTEDEIEFGVGVIVYCDQHLRPHKTGWCTVGNRHKVKLDTTSLDKTANDECRAKGYVLFSDLEKKWAEERLKKETKS